MVGADARSLSNNATDATREEARGDINWADRGCLISKATNGQLHSGVSYPTNPVRVWRSCDTTSPRIGCADSRDGLSLANNTRRGLQGCLEDVK